MKTSLRQFRATYVTSCRHREPCADQVYASELTSVQIVPGMGNDVAIDLISTHIRQKLNERSTQFRERLCVGPDGILSPSIASLPLDQHNNLILIPQTRQLQVSEELELRSRSISDQLSRASILSFAIRPPLGKTGSSSSIVWLLS
jgi:hypothetical protein